MRISWSATPVLGAVLILAAARAAAAPAGSGPGVARDADAPPVDVLVAASLEGAPTVAALRARLSAAREMVAPAGALPDPMVSLILQDIGFPRWTVGTEEMSMIGPDIQQDIPYPGKRAARRYAARADASAQEAELDRLQRELAAAVRTAYGRLFALDREREYLDAARDMLDMLAATAAGRYTVGETDQEAVLKAQLEVSRLGERLDDVAAERATEVATVDRLLGRQDGAPLGMVRELPAPPPPSPSWEELAVQSSPEVTVRRAQVAAVEKRVAVARLDLKPDFTAGAGVGLRGGFDPAVTLRFGLAYPLWKNEKQRPALRAAEADLAAAQADLRDSEASARAAVARLAADWVRDGRQVERYRQAIVPQSSAAIDAARAAYLVGRGDFLTVVDDFNRWLDARVELARREAGRFATWAEIDALVACPVGTQPQKEN